MSTTQPRQAVQGRAPGKVILLGEHAVVYGRSAIAGAIDRHVTVAVSTRGRANGNPPKTQLTIAPSVLATAATLVGIDARDLVITTAADLPHGVGLGSSAALSVALLRALAQFANRPIDDSTVCAHAFELEKAFHGFPSGLDNTVATYGGLMRFRRQHRPQALSVATPLSLVVALGRAPRQTKQTVTALRRGWESDPRHYEAMFDEIDGLMEAAVPAIRVGDLATLGALMNANHSILRRLGASTDELDHLVSLARAAGAWGAKLTGGGGGGAVICLGDAEQLRAVFMRADWQTFIVRLGTDQRGPYAADHAEPMDQHTDAHA